MPHGAKHCAVIGWHVPWLRAYRCQDLRVLWRELERLKTNAAPRGDGKMEGCSDEGGWEGTAHGRRAGGRMGWGLVVWVGARTGATVRARGQERGAGRRAVLRADGRRGHAHRRLGVLLSTPRSPSCSSPAACTPCLHDHASPALRPQRVAACGANDPQQLQVRCNTAARHCNTLPRRCNTLHSVATRCAPLQQTALRCNTAALRCNTAALRCTMLRCNMLR